MSNTVYQVEKRSDLKAKKLRRKGYVPGVVYGKEYQDSLPLQISLQEANKLLKDNTKTSIIKLEGMEKPINAIVKEVQRNGATYLPEHIDFQAISLREIITVTVPLHILGEENLQHRRLLFQPNLQELILTGPAEDLPERLEFDVTGLEYEEKVFLSAIPMPEGITVDAEEDALIGIVLSAQMATSEEEEEGVASEDGEVPVVGEKE